MTESDNRAAEIINGVISAIMSGGETAAEVYLTALAPELFANPIAHWLLVRAIEYFGQMLSIAGQKFADNIVIDIQVHGETSDVITAGSALAFAIASKNQTSIDQAIANLGKAYQASFRLDGWSHPS